MLKIKVYKAKKGDDYSHYVKINGQWFSWDSRKSEGLIEKEPNTQPMTERKIDNQQAPPALQKAINQAKKEMGISE